VLDALLVSILDSMTLKAATSAGAPASASDCSANRSLSAGVSVTVNLPPLRTQQYNS
jgi:hypothetical protein